VDNDNRSLNPPVALEILSYFLHNPEAADSLTEIARWRLMQERVRYSVEATKLAMQWLIEEGFVREEPRLGTERIFLLNPERREEAERLLQHVGDGLAER